MFRIEHIDHVALTVRDVTASIAWYKDVLGLEQRHAEAWNNRPAMLCAGETCLALFEAHEDNPDDAPNADTTLIMKHLAFRVDRDNFEAAQEALRAWDIPFTYSDHTISESIYFHDPNGHRLELTTYDR